MMALYVGGIVVGILMAILFKNTVFKGKSMPFVMELPNYRLPSFKSVVLLMWDKAKDFLQRAFTVIFVATIIIWFLQNFDTRFNVVANSSESLLALIGKWIAPLFAPLGFGDWKIATSLITGFTAKEAVVSTMSVLTGTSVSNLTQSLGTIFTPLTAASFLTFTLLYTPCVAAIAAIKKEMDSNWQALLVVVMQCVVAWIAAFVVYHIGILL
jgi:ferrous iron transport protein B